MSLFPLDAIHSTSHDKPKIKIKIIQDNRHNWHENIIMRNETNRCFITQDNLSAIERYELVNMIRSYNAFNIHIEQMEYVIENKPLTLLHLGFVNYDNIIQPLEEVEKSVAKLKIATNEMLNKISTDINSYIDNGKLTIACLSRFDMIMRYLRGIVPLREKDVL